MCFMLGLTKEISLEKIKSPREKRLFFFISIMAGNCRPSVFYTLKRKCMMSPS